MKGFIQKFNPLSNSIDLIGTTMLNSAISLKDEGWLTYVNAEKETKRYKLANVLVGDNKIALTVQIAEKTITRMTEANGTFAVGSEYLTTINKVPSTKEEGKHVFLGRMSHLSGVPTDNEGLDAMFGAFADEIVPAVAASKTGEPLTN